MDNAKELADKNPGYAVFDEAGKKVYPSASGSTGSGTLYRVRKSWTDAASQKGLLLMCWTMQNAVPMKIPVTLFLTRRERLYMRAAQPLLLTRCKKGDSLWAIAEKRLGNGTRYNEIKKLNGLTSDVIYAGQVLKLPNR